MPNSLWTRTNRANWDDRAKAHMLGGGDYYDLAALKAGGSSLLPLELKLAGDVEGRRLLHLMCHIGLDSISWSRRGAKVTAVDLSHESIGAARKLAMEVGAEVDFHPADVYALPAACAGPFDLVVMTYGILPWLSNIPALMRIVAERLRQGGRLVLVDGHPLTALWPDVSAADGFRPGNDRYFSSPVPRLRERPRSYGGGGELANRSSYQWQHSLGEIVQAVIDAGLQLKVLGEEPYGFYHRYPGMTRRADGYLDPPAGMPDFPLLLALQAVRA